MFDDANLTPYLYLDKSDRDKAVAYLHSRKMFLLCANACRSCPTDVVPIKDFESANKYENIKFLLCQSQKHRDIEIISTK